MERSPVEDDELSMDREESTASCSFAQQHVEDTAASGMTTSSADDTTEKLLIGFDTPASGR